MEYKNLIDDIKVPVLGLGTWTIGGEREPDYFRDKEWIEGIQNALQLGYTHIDTAELYGAGHCEELIGEAIKTFDRSKLFLTSKVSKVNLRYGDVIESAKKSLERLQTNYLDLYLIHAPNPEVPLEETMRAMDYLVDEGMVKNIGLSNFTLDKLKEAQELAKHKIVANQMEYSLLTRNIGICAGNKNMESETIPYCQENGIIIIAERPIERGKLLQPHLLLDRLADKYNKTKAQIAINWLISKKNIVTIPKSTNIEHLKENLGAIGWRLEEEDIFLLDQTNFE